MKIDPSVGCVSKVSNLKSSVFPAPLDPQSPKISPCWIPTLILLTARNLPKSNDVYILVRSSNRMGSRLLFTRSFSAFTSGSIPPPKWLKLPDAVSEHPTPTPGLLILSALIDPPLRPSRGCSVLTLMCRNRLYSHKMTKKNPSVPCIMLNTIPRVVTSQSNGSTT